MTRLVVLVSGNGSNLQAMLDAGLDVAAVVSNRADAYALERARCATVPTMVVAAVAGESRRDFDTRLADAVEAYRPERVVLAGWMRILSHAFLDRFANRVINLHPALPGELPGLHAIERAHAESSTSGRTRSGVMVHLVPDEGVDTGPVLASVEVPIFADDSLDEFAQRMHEAEHALLVHTLKNLTPSGEEPEA